MSFDVVGIGNAIVDVIAPADDNFIDMMGIEKGIMQLVERERGELLYAAMQDRVQAPGGSVANTLAGLSTLGLTSGFIGRVHDDALGRFYADAMGDGFVNPPVPGGELPTSRSMIFVSPDGERSMNTYLGISSELGPDDVADDVAGAAGILFLEGYLYDKPKGKAAFERAAKLCRDNGGRAGIALSDPFCVDRHRGDFRRLVKSLDYVIGNEHEWESLYQTDLSTALEMASEDAGLAICTRSGHDVLLVEGGDTVSVPVTPIKPIDATGAGDQFAAGFLYGYATGTSLEVAGRMGCIAAAEVISHYGARPETDLRELFAQAGLLETGRP